MQNFEKQRQWIQKERQKQAEERQLEINKILQESQIIEKQKKDRILEKREEQLKRQRYLSLE